VIEALADLLHVPFEFENAGSRIICNEPGVDYEEVEQGRRLRPTPAFRELPTAV
jgi:D-glycero-alpha-D-manno-heptose-7-phosphate kinase